MYSLLRCVLFCLPAEKSHHLALQALQRLMATPLAFLLKARVARDPKRVFGLDFANPVGLAAGLDKNGDYFEALGKLGFGFIEIGTVTPRPQDGNPLPRLFRLLPAQAIINRMGFNNKGVDYLVERIRSHRYRGVLGVNIGKNKDTPNERAVEDYLYCLQAVYPYADYITLNISSPNTPGLRALQAVEPLRELLQPLLMQRDLLAVKGRRVPLLVKIAPDLSMDEIDAMAQLFNELKLDGVIATNTTLSRDAVASLPESREAGGLSGRPVFSASTRVLAEFRKRLKPDIPLIGVGGIDSGQTAREKLAAGASLVQLYTGFIYQGPALLTQVARALRDMGR